VRNRFSRRRSGNAAVGHKLVLVFACLAATTLAVLIVGSVDAVKAASGSPSYPATLTLSGAGHSIPRSFFGLSVEYNELPDFEVEGASFNRVLKMIQPEDGSRMMLRLGGKSADRTYYQTTGTPPVPYARTIGPNYLKDLSALVASARLRVMLDLNLAVHSPALAVQFAQAARQMLPRSTLAGLEIGNEPDLYWRENWLSKERVPTTTSSISNTWNLNYSPADYRRDWLSYASALRSKVPGVPLGGPEIISSKPQWLDAIEGLGPLDPNFLSVHRYASSTCWPSTSRYYPSIATMLAPHSSFGLANSIQSAAGFAHSRGQALRLTEVNSISCGGNAGVADSFSTALWAPDALFELIVGGADSVSWHLRPDTPNAPFQPTSKGIKALPELYGLAVFAQMTRPGAHIVGSVLNTSRGQNVKAWVVRFANGNLRVLLINKSPNATNVTMHLGPAGRAYVRYLRAPGVGANTGIRFAGQTIGTDGRWHGRQHASGVASSHGLYYLRVPKYTLALVSAR
jgi:hypothetical protein